jgi:hypothetical protein
MNLDSINNNLSISYYKSIKKSLEKSNNDCEWLNNLIISTDVEKKEDVKEIKESNISDNNLYKKPWIKLNPIHKILKIKEFVNNLNIKDDEDKEVLKCELILLIKNKVLTKKECINYDEENGKILQIYKLQYQNNKYFYSNDI